jgi:hypothetical protein
MEGNRKEGTMAKKNDQSTLKELSRANRLLPCKLNEAELNVKGHELAQTVQEINSEEVRQKGIKDQLKARLSELQSRQTSIALIIAQHEEYREVPVLVKLRKDGTAEEVRMDIGETLVIRPLHDDEKQLKLEDAAEE